jgi:shikimate dehydrogenase
MVRAGLIGGKLGHSVSPQIHEAYGRLTGQEICYALHETDTQGLQALLVRLKAEGYAGVNVTIPHKKAILPLLDEVSPEAAAIGAVNTVRFEQGRSIGYNTDYDGLASLLRRSGIPLSGEDVVILGSGGAARCALALARDCGAARIAVASRNPQKADPALNAIGYDALDGMDRIGVLIHATPAGMQPDIDGCPVSDAVIQKSEAVIDIVYNPPETLLLQKAAALGKRCAGGLWMLCAQAVKAEEIWTGIPFDEAVCESIHRQMAALMRTNIVLIGMPGSGKSAVGRRLAERLGMGFLDTDALVEARHGVIRDIFASQGEAAFRAMELEAAQHAARRAHSVISTGGGIVLTAPAVRALKASGVAAYIDRPLALLLEETVTAHRPLLAGGREALTGLYEARRALYEGAADITVKNDAGLEQCVETVIKKLEEYRK